MHIEPLDVVIRFYPDGLATAINPTEPITLVSAEVPGFGYYEAPMARWIDWYVCRSATKEMMPRLRELCEDDESIARLDALRPSAALIALMCADADGPI